MLTDPIEVRKGGSARMTLQQREFTLGGQFNEDGTTRLDVALLTFEGKTKLELRLLGRGEGIGWYIQKRLQLDPLQIRALKAILGRGAGRVKSSSMPKSKMTGAINQRAQAHGQELSLSLCS